MGLQAFMAVLLDFLIFGARQDVNGIIRAEALVEFLNAGNQFLCGFRAVKGPFRVEAGVAVPTGFGKNLPKIFKEHLAPALIALTVGHHLPELHQSDVFFLFFRLLVYEILNLEAVAPAEKEEAFAGTAVPAPTPGFLVVALEVAGEVVVDNETDVGLVNSHPESNGCNDNVRVVLYEEFLVPCTLGI